MVQAWNDWNIRILDIWLSKVPSFLCHLCAFFEAMCWSFGLWRPEATWNHQSCGGEYRKRYLEMRKWPFRFIVHFWSSLHIYLFHIYTIYICIYIYIFCVCVWVHPFYGLVTQLQYITDHARTLKYIALKCVESVDLTCWTCYLYTIYSQSQGMDDSKPVGIDTSIPHGWTQKS